MSPLKSLWKDLKAVRKLGPSLALRHPMGWLGQNINCVQVPNVGPMWVRFRGSDASVLRQVFAGRTYDLDRFPQGARVQAALDRIVAAGRKPVIVDAGANIGASSVWFARRFPQAIVVAVEPDPANLAIARRNTSRFPNIVLAPAAIGGEPGMVDIVTFDGAGEATRTRRSDADGAPILTIPEAKALAGADTELLLVKVDIEGFENDLFAHNITWLDEIAALMIELHDWMLPGQHSSAPLQSAVLGRGFEILVRGESVFFVR